MTIYVTIKFKMTKGYEPPTLYDEQSGQFHDVVTSIIKQYNAKKDNVESEMPSLITLSGKELKEFGKLYADEVEFEKICFEIRDLEFGGIDEKEVSVCDYYKNNEFTIEDEEIFRYESFNASAFMPTYNRFKDWALLDREFDEDVFDENITIFKRYVQLTLEGKMFLGVEISKIESVTLEVC